MIPMERRAQNDENGENSRSGAQTFSGFNVCFTLRRESAPSLLFGQSLLPLASHKQGTRQVLFSRGLSTRFHAVPSGSLAPWSGCISTQEAQLLNDCPSEI